MSLQFELLLKLFVMLAIHVTCKKETAYAINVILLLHVGHTFGVHMSWCMVHVAILLPLLGNK